MPGPLKGPVLLTRNSHPPAAPQALTEFQVEAGKEQAGQSGPSWWTPGLSSKQLGREGQMWLCDSWSPEKRRSSPSYPHVQLLLQDNWKKLSPRRHLSARPRHLSFLGPSETTGTARVPLPFKRRGSRRNLWPRACTLVSPTPLLERVNETHSGRSPSLSPTPVFSCLKYS